MIMVEPQVTWTILTTFLGLKVSVALLSMEGQKGPSDFIKNNLICVPKMKDGLTGLK